MDHLNYYEERKYCPRCDDYVRYLMSLNLCYCAQCGTKVHLFSKKDQRDFLRSLKHGKLVKAQSEKRVS